MCVGVFSVVLSAVEMVPIYVCQQIYFETLVDSLDHPSAAWPETIVFWGLGTTCRQLLVCKYVSPELVVHLDPFLAGWPTHALKALIIPAHVYPPRLQSVSLA